jgi:transposase-like protein
MSKKSCQGNHPRIPLEYKGIQVNCCKFTRCENFGLTPEKAQETELFKEYNKNKLNRQVRDKDPFYKITGKRNKISSIKCLSCEVTNQNSSTSNQIIYVLKSNKAVHQELDRISSYLTEVGTACINPDCHSHETSTYNIIKRGKTAKGTQRYRCNDCKTSFTGKANQRRHDRSEIDKIFFKLLVAKVPLRQIKFILDMSMGMIYRRLDFIHQQCLAFVADRERQLYQSKSYERMYLCTDRQVHKSNWTNRKEKYNCEFYGIGTADSKSGYVLGFHFNYDVSMNPKIIEAEAGEIEDYKQLRHNREYARLWLKSDFKESSSAKNNERKELAGSIEEFINIKTKEGIEDEFMSSENLEKTTDIPVKGMEVHNEYTMVAHFLLIKKLTKNVDKTRFYLDLDVGMKTWYIAAFKEEIAQGDSDGFLVTMEKDMTVDNKQAYVFDAKQEISKFCGRKYSTLTYQELYRVVNDMIIKNMESPHIPPKSVDAWVKNPMPSMSEPDKRISSFTNIDRYDLEHQANLYRKGSLHAIDRFFMQIRRRVNMFERPFSSGSNQGRLWNGYSPYNPDMYQKLGDVFRVFYNYCQLSEKYNDTPAMRLGLAKGVVDIEKIIYFKKYNK